MTQIILQTPPETARSLIFDLGNGQWNIPGLRSLLEDVFANNTTFQNFEIEHQFERIGQKTMLLNALKIAQGDETPRLLLSIEDITERKQFETERSQLLTQEQAARQQAEEANRTKDEFLSNLSHELRNPLSTIIGWAQLLRAQTLDADTVTHALRVIDRSAKAQIKLIEDILDVSRITNGKLRLTTHLLEMSSVVGMAIESVQLSAEAKSIQIVADLASATVVGDSDRLHQVLWNLLSNAVKFTPPGGRVEVTLAPVQAQAEIQIRDTGQGISAALLPYVFDRFHQGDSSPTKQKQGLGLGLSIVRHIVELHGGTVRAESPGEGQGATFVVQLPLRQIPFVSGATAPEQPLDAISQAVESLEGLHILVVDDDMDSRDLMKHVLENLGAEVTAVESVRQALSALLQSPRRYDVLLSDIGMPEEDGLALIRQVRALDGEAGGQIPAAAITAYASEQERQQAIEAGFQMHLAKPVNPTQLVLLVANLVAIGCDRGNFGRQI